MPGAPRRALIVRLSSIGDVIHTLPAYSALRRAWPGTELGWAVEPAAAPLVQRLPGPVTTHVLTTARWRRRWWHPSTAGEIGTAISLLRDRDYGLALDFQGLVKSAVVGRLSGAPVVGMHRENLREPVAARLYSSTAPPFDESDHVVHRALALCAAVGVEAGGVEFPPLFDDVDRAYVEQRLEELGRPPFAVLHCVANWASKRWPAERWTALGERLARETGMEVLWVWGPGEEEEVGRLAAAAGSGNRLAFPTTLPQMAALLARAELFVGGDSAPLHLAVAVQAPAVGVFGPTDPGRTGPVDPVDPAVHRRLPCSFCHRRECPLGTRECLETLDVATVLEAALLRCRTPGTGAR